jgi:hypothetical protein
MAKNKKVREICNLLNPSFMTTLTGQAPSKTTGDLIADLQSKISELKKILPADPDNLLLGKILGNEILIAAIQYKPQDGKSAGYVENTLQLKKALVNSLLLENGIIVSDAAYESINNLKSPELQNALRTLLENKRSISKTSEIIEEDGNLITLRAAAKTFENTNKGKENKKLTPAFVTLLENPQFSSLIANEKDISKTLGINDVGCITLIREKLFPKPTSNLSGDRESSFKYGANSADASPPHTTGAQPAGTTKVVR